MYSSTNQNNNLPKNSIIYCRVSSENQTNGISLESQEALCKKFAKTNNLNIKAIYKEIGSAYNTNSNVQILKRKANISRFRNKTIIISSVDRFSRRSNNGVSLMNKLTKKNNTLVFINNNIIIDNLCTADTLRRFYKELDDAEKESKKISDRIKTTKAHLKSQGYYIGGKVPYGKIIVKDDMDRKKLYIDENKIPILKFIGACHNGTRIMTETLNHLMDNISPYDVSNTHKIIIDDVNGNPCNTFEGDLSFKNISDLLNDYEVDMPTKWSIQKVKKCWELWNEIITKEEYNYLRNLCHYPLLDEEKEEKEEKDENQQQFEDDDTTEMDISDFEIIDSQTSNHESEEDNQINAIAKTIKRKRRKDNITSSDSSDNDSDEEDDYSNVSNIVGQLRQAMSTLNLDNSNSSNQNNQNNRSSFVMPVIINLNNNKRKKHKKRKTKNKKR